MGYHSNAVMTTLREERIRRRMSAQTLGNRSGVPRTVIANLETRRRGTLSVDELFALAEALDLDVADLVSGAALCNVCKNDPPDGFTCNRCLRGGDVRGSGDDLDDAEDADDTENPDVSSPGDEERTRRGRGDGAVRDLTRECDRGHKLDEKGRCPCGTWERGPRNATTNADGRRGHVNLDVIEDYDDKYTDDGAEALSDWYGGDRD